MRSVNISELRQNLPAMLDAVIQGGEALLVTKRGRAVVKIVPLNADDADEEAHPLRAVPIELAADFDDPLLDFVIEEHQG